MSDMSFRRATSTKIHVMAIDGVVNVNSLFSLAIFVGLTSTDPNSNLTGADSPCVARSRLAEELVACHVYSFSSFLFSSLIALALKQAIKISNGDSDILNAEHANVNTAAFRAGILISALGSVIGCGFLTMALVDLVQIKLGSLGCGSLNTFAAIGPLVILVPFALTIYVFLVLYAFTR